MTVKNNNKFFKQEIPLQNYVCMGVITNTVTGETQNVFIPAERVFLNLHMLFTLRLK